MITVASRAKSSTGTSYSPSPISRSLPGQTSRSLSEDPPGGETAQERTAPSRPHRPSEAIPPSRPRRRARRRRAPCGTADPRAGQAEGWQLRERREEYQDVVPSPRSRSRCVRHTSAASATSGGVDQDGTDRGYRESEVQEQKTADGTMLAPMADLDAFIERSRVKPGEVKSDCRVTGRPPVPAEVATGRNRLPPSARCRDVEAPRPSRSATQPPWHRLAFEVRYGTVRADGAPSLTPHHGRDEPPCATSPSATLSSPRLLLGVVHRPSPTSRPSSAGSTTGTAPGRSGTTGTAPGPATDASEARWVEVAQHRRPSPSAPTQGLLEAGHDLRQQRRQPLAAGERRRLGAEPGRQPAGHVRPVDERSERRLLDPDGEQHRT